jgi:hypothetical protein
VERNSVKSLQDIRKRSFEVARAAAAAGAPGADMLTPDEALVALRALMARVPDVVALTKLERDTLRRSATMSESAIIAAIGVLEMSDEVAQLVGKAEDVKRLHASDNDWDVFEKELKSAWHLVAGSNVVRRQRTRLLAVQAYRIAQQLARTPGNANLNEHVKNVMRLRNLGRRRKAVVQTAEAEAPTGENP